MGKYFQEGLSQQVVSPAKYPPPPLLTVDQALHVQDLTQSGQLRDYHSHCTDEETEAERGEQTDKIAQQVREIIRTGPQGF